MKEMMREEYLEFKKKDIAWAEEQVRFLHENAGKWPGLKYPDSRPIADLKDMLEGSARLYPDHTAIYQKMKHGEPYTEIKFSKLMEDVNALGTALIAHGLKGKHIAVTGENSYWWAVSYFAVVCGTGIAVPLDKELSASEMAQVLSDAEVSAILYQDKYEERFINMKEAGEVKLEMLVNYNRSENTEKAFGFDALIEEGKKLMDGGDRSFLDAQIDAEEMSVLIFTSGTTGVSKGVMLSQRNICADLMAAPTVLKVTDHEIFFSVLPIHHMYENVEGLLMPLYKGSAIAYCEGLKYIQKNLAEVRPTFFLGVPLIFESLYKKIMQNVKKQGKEATLKKGIKINNFTKKLGIDLAPKLFKDIHALFGGRMHILICGGAAINPDVLQAFRDFGILALQGYGLTECAPIGALNPDTIPKNAAAGRTVPTFGTKIIDPDEEGNGEILLTGDNVMLGYYKRPDLTAEVIEMIDGVRWYHTGDIGHIDEDGYLFVTGRKKNVIITKNGKNVFPEELEYYLSNLELVGESMVWAAEDEGGQDSVIVASIVPNWDEVKERLGRDDIDTVNPSAELLKEVEELLWVDVDKINADSPMFKKIRRIIVRTKEFEKNSSKKIKRFVESNRG